MAKNFDLEAGDAIAIDDGRVIVTLREKSGRRAKLSVEAGRGVKVERLQRVEPVVDVVAREGLAAK